MNRKNFKAGKENCIKNVVRCLFVCLCFCISQKMKLNFFLLFSPFQSEGGNNRITFLSCLFLKPIFVGMKNKKFKSNLIVVVVSVGDLAAVLVEPQEVMRQ